MQGRGFADLFLREAEHHVFVENVEVTVRALADETPVERLGHEQEVPFHGARTVDQVLPELAGQALGVVAAQAVDAVVVQQHAVAVRDAGVVDAGMAGLLEPVLRIAGHVLPQQFGRRQHLVVVILVVLVVHPAGFFGQLAAVLLGLGAVIEADHGRIVSVEQLGHVIPFAEVHALGRDADVVVGGADVGGRRHRVVGGARVPVDAHLAGGGDAAFRLQGGNVPVGVGQFRDGRRAETVGGQRKSRAIDRVPARVVHHAVEHHVDGVQRAGARVHRFAAGPVAEAHEVRERRHGVGFARVVGHIGIDGEVVLCAVGAAGPVALAGGRVVFDPLAAGGMNGLEPQAIDVQLVEVFQAEFIEVAAAEEFLGELFERAAAGLGGVGRLDGEDVEFIHRLLKGLARRDDDGVVAADSAFRPFGVPGPVAVGFAGGHEARGHPVGAALVHRQRLFPAARPQRHGNGLPVAGSDVVGVFGGDAVAIRRHDAVGPAVAVHVVVGVVTPAHVGE